MNLDWSEQSRAFRAEVREFFREHLTDELRHAGLAMTSVYADPGASRAWQSILAAKGWAAPAWPVEYGGCGWSMEQQYIFACERAAAGAPPLSPMGLQMCAPALIRFGTPAQKSHFLPRMLSGEHLWCQGYSEPESGSDLASLQMAAVAEGDHFVCIGSKIWTTHADLANWMFCLVRTSRELKPQEGITFLLIDMTSPGITVQPIVSPAGEHIQNQVFFQNVRVPRLNVVGEVGGGWTVAKYLLEFERGGGAYAPELHARLRELRTYAAKARGRHGGSLLDDADFRIRLAVVEIKVAALEVYEWRALSALSKGGSPGAAASVMKILGTELRQSVTELAMDAAGRYGLAYQPQAGKPGGEVRALHARDTVGPVFAALAPLRYLNERAGSIYAGSNEIQRNILAKILLAS